jgi:hypothetical protein
MAAIVQYLHLHPADIAILTELHLTPGTTPSVDGYSLLWLPRAVGTASLRGGVALLLRQGVDTVSHAVVVDTFPRADVTWFKLSLSTVAQPLFIAAVYLPPHSSSFVCSSCPNISCPKAHVHLALSHLQSSVPRYCVDGHVLVAGDFNVQAQLPVASRRWCDVQHAFSHPCVVNANPTTHSGSLLPTRRDPVNGTESVLDLLYTSPQLTAPGATWIDSGAAVSHHYALWATLSLPSIHHSHGITDFNQPSLITSVLP